MNVPKCIKKKTQNQYTECAKLSIQTQIKYTE